MAHEAHEVPVAAFRGRESATRDRADRRSRQAPAGHRSLRAPPGRARPSRGDRCSQAVRFGPQGLQNLEGMLRALCDFGDRRLHGADRLR
jgi:hypothetical protein